MVMRVVCPILVVGLVAVFTPPAVAAPPSTGPGCISRPDVAALDEYCPALPGADGRGSNRGPKLERVLPRKTVERLEKAGAVGRALLALPVTAPRQQIGHNARGRGLDADELLTQGRLGHRAKPPGNPVTASVTAATNGDVGVVFGSALLVSGFGIAGAGWLRFRRRYPF